MTSWEGKSKGTKIGYGIFIFILRKFGVIPAYVLLRIVALYYVIFSLRTSAIMLDFFRRRIGLSKFRSFIKLYRNYYLFGQSLIDKIVLMSGIPNRLTFNFEGEENLRKIVSMGRGGILLSAHIGNWEIAGFLLKRLKIKFNIVMYDGEQKQIKEYLERIVGERGFNIIVIREDISHVYQIINALSHNEIVCIHADRFLDNHRTISAEFLGKKANFPLGPFLLASRLKVPLSFVFAVKESTYHYHFFASDIKEFVTTNKNIAPDRIFSDFITELENKIKRYPEQWYNYYNFWTA